MSITHHAKFENYHIIFLGVISDYTSVAFNLSSSLVYFIGKFLCTVDRLGDFDVTVHTDDPTTTVNASSQLCTHHMGVPAKKTTLLYCDGGYVSGRYVRVTNQPNRTLSICEFEIY